MEHSAFEETTCTRSCKQRTNHGGATALSCYRHFAGITIEARQDLLQELECGDHILHGEVSLATRGHETEGTETILDDSDDRVGRLGKFCTIYTGGSSRAYDKRSSMNPVCMQGSSANTTSNKRKSLRDRLFQKRK